MSMTPAFSPGPWITQGALGGSPRRCTLEDLYEQCWFHMAEKMPSSVMLGSRPISWRRRSYSSGLRPWAATSSGVMRGSLGIIGCGSRRGVGPCLGDNAAARKGPAPRFLEFTAGDDSSGARERLGEPGEQAAAVGAAHGGFDVVLRMRH